MNTSSYEEKIIKIFKKENINFEREKTFSDLKNGLYRFDFYLKENNCIIEVHGAQHYEYIKKFYKSKNEWYASKERDRKKCSYCLAHKIPLYIIPYWEIDNIKNFNNILQDKFKVKNMWHVDNTKILK